MRYHFSGVGGAGMNPLARLMAARGHAVQGSDRDFDRGRNPAVADLLRAAGVELLPQDGSAVDAEVDLLVHSAAVEPTVPEMVQARALQVPTQARPALLAEIVNAGAPGIAIAGTSGKSTVTGMLAWILRSVDRSATVLGGAALAEAGANHMGCFAAGLLDEPVIAEACESDGSLVGYQAGIGVILNISRDHAEVEQLRQQFATFVQHSAQVVIFADDALALELAAEHPRVSTFGSALVPPLTNPQQISRPHVQLEVLNVGPWRSTGQLTYHGSDANTNAQALLDLPQPGQYTLENGCAAVAVALAMGVDLAAACAALSSFPGVARRFQIAGRTESGITVVDDYAHNGAKISAAVQAAQAGSERVVAVFQPHGYGPAKFLRDELRQLWPALLRPQDRLCYAPIYDAGGTADRSISSDELAADLPGDLRCGAAADHAAVLSWVAEQALPGDTVLVMGARDPRLGELSQTLAELL